MILTTRSIYDGTRLIVGQMYDATIMVRTPRGEIVTVPRFWVETPRLCCVRCGKGALLKIDRAKREYAECPDHARHMYEANWAASHDAKQYDRATRRKLAKEAGKWLQRWKQTKQGKAYAATFERAAQRINEQAQ